MGLKEVMFNHEVKVFKVKDSKSKTKAIGSVTFKMGDTAMFCVKGLKLVEGSKGLFLSMPSEKNKDGEYQDTAFPLTGDFRKELEADFIEAFQAL